MILEVCVDSVESAVNAELGGADRIELCGDLIVGGTTPSLALYERIREKINIPIHVLLRPRFGDFLYSEEEIEILTRQAEAFSKAGATYYPNLNTSLSISFDQRASWAVRKDCPQLAAAADEWHKQNMTSPAYTASMKRYFEISKAMPHSPILSLKEGKISHYDNLFKKYAQEIGWDWRLLASLAYTESNFDTTAVSWAGAKGLMQLMPATARAMGVPPGKEQNPEESIKAAVKYIAATDRSLSMVPDKQERIKFILASYNAGLGHIFDAIALADKYGKNKTVWTDNVENYILLKSNEEYFTDPVCKNGYFRGIETYNFVRDINSRYESYKKKIKS